MFEHIQNKFQQFSSKFAVWLGDEIPDGMTPFGDLPKDINIDLSFLSNVLRYESFDNMTSLFHNRNSIGFILETNVLLGSSEEKEDILASLITDIVPHGVDIQFLQWGSPKISPLLDAFAENRSKSENYKWLAEKRIEFLRKGAFTSLSKNHTILLKDVRNFIVISMSKQDESQVGELISLRDDIESTLNSINLASRVINAQEFKSILYDIINPTSSTYPHDFEWNEYDSLSNQLTDPEWKVRITPNFLRFSSEDESVDVKSFTVKKFPKKPTQWKTGENLGQLFNPTLQIPCPFLISFTLRKIKQEKAHTETQINNVKAENNAKSKLAKFKASVKDEYDDWEYVKHRLANGDSLVRTFYQVVLFSKTEESNYCERRVRDLFRANGWVLKKERFLQMQSWLAALPMMLTEGLYDDLRTSGKIQTMTAFNAVNVAPLQGEWKGTKTPGLLLPGRRGQISFWHPYDNDSGNFNIAIAAAPGKGKSVLVQEFIMSILGANGQAHVIDQGHSQQKICKLLGGEFIEFKSGSPICLNPFTFIQDIDEAMELLKPMVSSMARPLRGATEEEMSYIEQAIKGAYQWEGNDTSIQTVSKWLKEQNNETCKTLSNLLYTYCEGVSAKIFLGKCSIDFNNPYLVWELLDLKSRKELRRIVLQLIIYQTSEKMFKGDRSKVKTCIIDESWDLFDDDNNAAAKFIEAGYRTARKFSANFVSIAHSIFDFHKNSMSKAAYDCSDFKITLGQTEEAINKMKAEKIVDMDGIVERMYKSLQITKDFSECIIKGPSGMSIHRLILDPYCRTLTSTKGHEFEGVNQLVHAGMPLHEAIDKVTRRYQNV